MGAPDKTHLELHQFGVEQFLFQKNYLSPSGKFEMSSLTENNQAEYANIHPGKRNF